MIVLCMYMYVCLYVCVYVCMYVCMYVCTYEHDSARYFSIVRRRAACACLDSRSTSVSNTMCIWLHTNIHSCKCIYRLEYLDCPWNTVPNIHAYRNIDQQTVYKRIQMWTYLKIAAVSCRADRWLQTRVGGDFLYHFLDNKPVIWLIWEWYEVLSSFHTHTYIYLSLFPASDGLHSMW